MRKEFTLHERNSHRWKKGNRATLAPYKLLALILYGNYDWLNWDGNRVWCKTSAIGKITNFTIRDVRNHFSILHNFGFILELIYPDHGYVSFMIKEPRNLVCGDGQDLLEKTPAPIGEDYAE